MEASKKKGYCSTLLEVSASTEIPIAIATAAAV
jgi:hypothetical protein